MRATATKLNTAGSKPGQAWNYSDRVRTLLLERKETLTKEHNKKGKESATDRHRTMSPPDTYNRNNTHADSKGLEARETLTSMARNSLNNFTAVLRQKSIFERANEDTDSLQERHDKLST